MFVRFPRDTTDDAIRVQHQALRRLGKRICLGLDGDLWLVLHLMIAGRLHWRKKGAPVSRPRGLAALDFSHGTLLWTEAGSQKRASLHLVAGEQGLKNLDPGGLEVFQVDLQDFAAVLKSANHTLKRALTDPRLFSGIGNAYSDEILHAARMSPLKLTRSLSDEEIERLYAATRDTLLLWIERLRRDARTSPTPKTSRAPDRSSAAPSSSCGTPSRAIFSEGVTSTYPTICMRSGRERTHSTTTVACSSTTSPPPCPVSARA